MQYLRMLLVLSLAIVAFGGAVPAVSAASQKPFHLVKICDPAGCVVTGSNFAAIPAGSEIHYTGPDPDHLVPVLTIKNGTTTGQCAIGSVFGSPSAPGTCALAGGTGRLTQFHLDVVVTFDGSRWYWDGWYWFGN